MHFRSKLLSNTSNSVSLEIYFQMVHDSIARYGPPSLHSCKWEARLVSAVGSVYSKFLHLCNTKHNSTKPELLCTVWLHYYEAS